MQQIFEVKGVFFNIEATQDVHTVYQETDYGKRPLYKEIPYTNGYIINPTEYCRKNFTQEEYEKIIADIKYEWWYNDSLYKWVNIENATLLLQRLDKFMRLRKDEL